MVAIFNLCYSLFWNKTAVFLCNIPFSWVWWDESDDIAMIQTQESKSTVWER